MGYIQDLRAWVGHRPILLAGAAVLLVDGEGCLLMNFRPDNLTWGIPGGAMELGESLEETARRETFEETGLKVEGLTLFGVYSGPNFFYRYPNGDEVYNVTVVYTCSSYHGVLDEFNEESLRLQFFAPEQIILDQTSPPIQPILTEWVKSRRQSPG